MADQGRAEVGRIRKVSMTVTIGPFDGRGWVEHGGSFTAYRWAWFRVVVDRKEPTLTMSGQRKITNNFTDREWARRG